jgi:hypothetical protein
MALTDVHGPIDYLLLEFPGDRPLDDAAAALADLVESGTVRLLDLAVVRKDDGSTFSGITLDDSGFSAFAGAQSGLLGDDDLRLAADAMVPGTVAAFILYENAWAVPFVGAARQAGGSMIASERIPAQDVMDALDALDALDAAV